MASLALGDSHAMYAESLDDIVISELAKHWLAMHQQQPALLLLAESEKAKALTIQEAFAEAGIPVWGAMFPALIAEGRFTSSGALLLPLPEDVQVYLSEPLAEPDSVEIMMAALADKVDNGQTLFLVFDAMVPNIATMLEEIYAEFGAQITYAGVNAGSETFQPQPCLLAHQKFVGGRVLALVLPKSDGALLEHGYPEPSGTVAATSSEGNLIRTLDWKPAFKAYRELVQQQYGVAIDHENFYGLAVHYPFGIIRANGEILVRIPVAISENEGLFCVGEIPPNSMLMLLEGPEEALHEGVRHLSRRIHDANWKRSMLFYCAGRRMHLGETESQRELDTLTNQTGSFSGALSLGEIGTTSRDQYPLFHNATLVAVSIE